MAYSSSRPTSTFLAGTSTSSSIRQQSNHNAVSHQQSLALSSRIASKKTELENLIQLRDLSGVMAMQMQALEAKIAVACVLANWDNVLRAISMASSKFGMFFGLEALSIVFPRTCFSESLTLHGNLAKAAVSISTKQQSSSLETHNSSTLERHLPATLVRIPVEEREKPQD
ncbi:hypothetical protein CNMCM6106_005129 [Aspergillus hiratsukae]|uniref:DASH complex subunit DAD2 n=1 Tax=Aspergillus hiratsukae TaxID=1194566 RepID=A0A8H6V1F0_9EURO|nr:hypothetical protein CNMCM6106_005129 [Aspergillus hiratsukae]